jgi:hypothetical protein
MAQAAVAVASNLPLWSTTSAADVANERLMLTTRPLHRTTPVCSVIGRNSRARSSIVLYVASAGKIGLIAEPSAESSSENVKPPWTMAPFMTRFIGRPKVPRAT